MENIKEIMKMLEINQAAVIMSDFGRRYFTNFSSSAGILVITKEKAVFATDFRYIEKAKNEISHIEVVLLKKKTEFLSEVLKENNISEILIESDILSFAEFESLSKNLEEINVNSSDKLSRKIRELRSVKSPSEIEFIKKSQAITDEAFSYILTKINEGVSEKEIALELEFFMRKMGSCGMAFDVIAASGKNSSMPHAEPTDKKLEKGDFLTLDFGARYKGYCSDMTRTVAIGSVSEEQKKVYEIVLEAQNKAFEQIKEGIECSLIDKAARDYIASFGYGDNFGHSLGHSLGLEIHESPAFSPSDKTLIKKGMIITVEPGIYIENKFGVRIEDMVLITENGFENLTHSRKDLIIV